MFTKLMGVKWLPPTKSPSACMKLSSQEVLLPDNFHRERNKIKGQNTVALSWITVLCFDHRNKIGSDLRMMVRPVPEEGSLKLNSTPQDVFV